MAQVRAAVGAVHLGALHPQQAVHLGLHRIGRQRLEIAGPAGAGIVLGGSVKQRLAAADAGVGAGLLVVGVLACEGAFGRLVPGHVKSQGLGPFLGEQGLPLGVGFLDLEAHDEQLISMEDAQSGGKPAYDRRDPACSSNGACSSASKVLTSGKVAKFRLTDGLLAQMVAQHVLGVGACSIKSAAWPAWLLR
jgi:hypothetical protein